MNNANYSNFPLKLETFKYFSPFSGIMQLSKTEILVLEQVAKGNKYVTEVAFAIKKSVKQIYLTVNTLKDKGFLENERGMLKPKNTLHVALLFQLLSDTQNLAPVLADSGMPILQSLQKQSTISEISKNTKLKKSIIYKKIRELASRSIINTKSGYELNKKIWPKLNAFFEELNRYETSIDPRVPASSTIYNKTDEEILFSSKEELDATKTAFSVYENFGVKLYPPKKYYCLPKKVLSIKKIMQHTLFVVEQEKDSRNLLLAALFYIKYKKKINLKHEILKNLDMILAKKYVEGYPSYAEIKEKAEIYGIKV